MVIRQMPVKLHLENASLCPPDLYIKCFYWCLCPILKVTVKESEKLSDESVTMTLHASG